MQIQFFVEIFAVKAKRPKHKKQIDYQFALLLFQMFLITHPIYSIISETIWRFRSLVSGHNLNIPF